MFMTTGRRDEVFQTYATAARATATSISRKPIMVEMTTNTYTYKQAVKL